MKQIREVTQKNKKLVIEQKKATENKRRYDT